LGYEIINLGRGEPVVVADFVEQIERYAASKAYFIPALLPDIDRPCAFADIGKARRLLNFSPVVSLEEGVALFWQWYCREGLEKEAPLAV
jgi:UDP-glucuronate 4-epimerase